MQPKGNNDWERWRGGVDKRLDNVEADVSGARKWLVGHETRLRHVEIRVAVYAAAGALAGSALAIIGHWLLDKL